MTQADPASPAPLSDALLHRMDAWWRAANYLSVGQIYLLDNCRSSQSMLAVPKGVLAMFANTASAVFCSA